jgi:hypothetical protein
MVNESDLKATFTKKMIDTILNLEKMTVFFQTR